MNSAWLILLFPYVVIGFFVWMAFAEYQNSPGRRAVGAAIMWPIIALIHAVRGSYEAIVEAFK